MYMFPIIWTFPQLEFVDDDLTQFPVEMKSNFWFDCYHGFGTRLILVDRYFDIIAIIQFVFFFQASVSFFVLFGYTTLRLISIALYYNTNMCKCYAVRTVVPWIISGLFCSIVIFVPSMVVSYVGFFGLTFWMLSYAFLFILSFGFFMFSINLPYVAILWKIEVF